MPTDAPLYCRISREYIDTLHKMPSVWISWVPGITYEEGKRRPYRLVINAGFPSPSSRTGQGTVGDWVYVDREGRTQIAHPYTL